MKQTSSVQAEHQNKEKVTHRERFLAKMEAMVPWQRLIDALSPSYLPNVVDKRGRDETDPQGQSMVLQYEGPHWRRCGNRADTYRGCHLG